MCHAKVDDFTLCKGSPESGVSLNSESKLQRIIEEIEDSGIGLLPCAFNGDGVGDVGLFDEDELFMDRAQGASTPVASKPAFAHGKHPERVVLRIDNVPWVRRQVTYTGAFSLTYALVQDITPPAIAAWLKHPVERVHVLLDRKGKTMSHAFAEMVDELAAKAALRTSQNSVLGRGKRARGVTVTRSSQEELMRAVSKDFSLAVVHVLSILWSCSCSHPGRATSMALIPRLQVSGTSNSSPLSSAASSLRQS